MAIEALELRVMLSAAQVDWPTAPFAGTQLKNTLYVNQNGYATVSTQLPPAGTADTYAVFYDDPGPMTAILTGPARTRVAYYEGPGKPDRSSIIGATKTSTSVSGKAKSKGLINLRVQADASAAGGTYELAVDGPIHNIVRPLAISRNTHTGKSFAGISNAYDCDFFEFTTTQAGDWTVVIDGMHGFDPTLNVYDSAGSPVGGTFTQPVDKTGVGGAEAWTGRKLAAGKQYFLRIDGKDDSLGLFAIRVERGHLPKVSIVASDRNASASGANTASFTISRDRGSNATNPLKVHYSISGTAQNGTDYKKIRDAVTIPANKRSATITVTPKLGALLSESKTITLTLRADPLYTISPKATASVQIKPSAAASAWPAAPFTSGKRTDTIYVNQNGDAFLKRKVLAPQGFEGYQFFLDDSGYMTVSTTGSLQTEVAYYNRGNRPQQIDAGDAQNGNGHIRFKVPIDREMRYLGVQVKGDTLTGTYGLKLDGPAVATIERIPISRLNNAGASGSDISGGGDYDFYEFTTTVAGNWIVRVIPDLVSSYGNGRLDATMNIFDSNGAPVGGSFTHPVDAGGEGVTERWTGINLPAGAKYYIRVDGKAQSLGGYGVSIYPADVPRMNIAATDPDASTTQRNSGQFTITRSFSSNKPLTVHYAISGTAVNGTDYKLLGGSVVIPANHISATVAVTPLATSLADGDHTVILILRPNSDYSFIGKKKAMVTIHDGAA